MYMKVEQLWFDGEKKKVEIWKKQMSHKTQVLEIQSLCLCWFSLFFENNKKH